MSPVRFHVVLVLPCLLLAESRPQFVWQGDVDGIDVVSIHGNEMHVKVHEGGPVQRQRFQFFDPLPEAHQDVRLEVLEGRGYVHVVDQPRLENGYTLAFAIEDRQPGSSFYSIALYWNVADRAFERRSVAQVSWTGLVDEEAIISCRAKGCSSSASRGAPVENERFHYSNPLPNRAVEVHLEGTTGRGEIRLIEQPRESNHYTARVWIRDPQSGAEQYSFNLVWDRAKGKSSQAAPVPVASAGLLWSGVVDGRVHVTVQGGSALSEVIDGRPISKEHASFLRLLPTQADLMPVIKKIRGRGQVEIVERPSAANHFRLVFEIDGTGGGPDTYEVEVDW